MSMPRAVVPSSVLLPGPAATVLVCCRARVVASVLAVRRGRASAHVVLESADRQVTRVWPGRVAGQSLQDAGDPHGHIQPGAACVDLPGGQPAGQPLPGPGRPRPRVEPPGGRDLFLHGEVAVCASH
jgi:hypothetical protein